MSWGESLCILFGDPLLKKLVLFWGQALAGCVGIRSLFSSVASRGRPDRRKHVGFETGNGRSNGSLALSHGDDVVVVFRAWIARCCRGGVERERETRCVVDRGASLSGGELTLHSALYGYHAVVRCCTHTPSDVWRDASIMERHFASYHMLS